MSAPVPGNPFSAEGTWHRGSTHNHTTASDGQHSVAELAEWYEGQGMDFIAITDHNVVADVSDKGDGNITVIPGAEVGVCWDEALGAEVLCLGIDEIKRLGVHPQEVICDVLEQGGLPYISHPHLSGVYSGLMMDLDGLVGIEVYNNAAHVVWNRGVASIHFDDLLGVGKIVWGLASDDLHRIRDIGPQAWIEVKAVANDRETILAAMRSGLYYSTTGPEIRDISFSDTHITVKCSAAKRIVFSTLPWLSKKVDAEGDGTITEATLELYSMGSAQKIEETMEYLVEHRGLSTAKNLKPHVRIEIDDGCGKFAWSNPIPFI